MKAALASERVSIRKSLPAGVPLILLMCASIALSGCQRTNGGGGTAPQPPPTAGSVVSGGPGVDKTVADRAHGPYDCEKWRTCAAPVGEMVVAGAMGLHTCLVSLVGPKTVLTASHCVPWENTISDGSFQGGCWIRWVGRKGFPARVVECARVLGGSHLSAANEGTIQSDYAFLELKDEVPRRPLEIQSGPQPKRAYIRLYGVEVVGGRRELHDRVCYHLPELEIPGRKMPQPGSALLLPECPVRHGDSGSPLLNRKGAVVGVLSFVDESDGRGAWKSVAVGSLVPPLPAIEKQK